MKRLIIPMRVEAFLTNGKSADNKNVPVVAPDYKKVSYTSFLGSKNTPGDFARSTPLEAGVHLHFILPDAFTYQGEEYQRVPNRYVVTRLYPQDGQIEAKCFMVESDFMSTDAAYAKSITIPRFQETDLRRNWRYLGRNYEVEQNPPAGDGDEYLERLTAVGAGDPMFAAYYPSCSSVFGFHDKMEGVPLGSTVSYAVFGYYSDSKADPFSEVETEEDFRRILEEMQLSVDLEESVLEEIKLSVEPEKSDLKKSKLVKSGSFKDAQGEALACQGLVLFGLVSGINWKGKDAEYPVKPREEIQIAVGNTSAEALAAAITDKVGGSSKLERLLLALQYDLAESGSLWDGNYKIDDEIFLRQFERLSGGEMGCALSFDGNAAQKKEMAGYGGVYSAYCKASRKLQALLRRLEEARTKLYFVWEQYMLCYENPKEIPVDAPAKEKMLAEIHKIYGEQITGLAAQIKEQGNLVAACKKELVDILGSQANLVDTAAEPFYQPKDPVLLLYGPGVKRAYAFGEDGRFREDGTLFCQMEVVETNIETKEILSLVKGKPDAAWLPVEYETLLYQAVVLEEACRGTIEKQLGVLTIVGNKPSEVAINTYSNEGIALFMEWESEYYSTGNAGAPEDSLRDWCYEAGETTYHYEGKTVPAQSKPLLFSGRTLLTPHAVFNLSEKLSQWLKAHSGDSEALAAAEIIKELGVISQNLDGFTFAFSGEKQAYQFPIVGTGGDEVQAALVRDNVLPERRSIWQEGLLCPIRGGYFGMRRLSIVGTFGQVENIVDPSYYGKKKICFSETLERYDDYYALLPPAFTAPLRLNFDFTSAAGEMIASPAVESSPVCGIVVPELLNHRLVIYKEDGNCVGSVNTAYRDGKACARWVSAQSPDLQFEKEEIGNQQLQDFIFGLLTVEDALQRLMQLMEEHYARKLVPGENKSVWGRPFVLVRGRIGLEYLSGAEFDKSLGSFGKYDTRDVENLKIPIAFGDKERVTDGVLGYFSDDYGFGGMVPAFGAGREDNTGYILSEKAFSMSVAEGEKGVTLFMEPHGRATIHTGLFPGRTVSLEAVHANCADRLLLMAELNPIITGTDRIAFPLEGYEWSYRKEDVFLRDKTNLPLTEFGETVIMEGFMVKEMGNE